MLWPYQCLSWNAATRLSKIRDNYEVIDKIGGPIDFPVNAKLTLLDLSNIRSGLRVELDQPKWFMREGQFTISLQMDGVRIFSLVFSLFHYGVDIAAFIGAIQGRDIEGMLAQYRELTKAAHGMRPRDLLIEIFRMLCAKLQVRHIFAVSDQYRIQRSRYFGEAGHYKFHSDYDEVWSERGGVRADQSSFRLPVEVGQRDLSTVPSKKRAMYRRRYGMLDEIAVTMQQNYPFLQKELH